MPTIAPPTVRYDLFRRVHHGLAWDLWPTPADLARPRMMPSFCLLPAVLATFLYENEIDAGDWQLRAVDVHSGAVVAVVMIGESI